MILNCSGHDFRGRGGVAINDDDQRHIFGIAASRFVNGWSGVLASAFDRYDHFVARQELAGNVNRLIQQTAGVITQVEHKLAHPFFFQIGDRITQFIVSRALKSADQTDIACRRPDHERVAD